MVLHGAPGGEHPGRDVRVGQALGEQGGDLLAPAFTVVGGKPVHDPDKWLAR